jgi:TonB family protein
MLILTSATVNNSRVLNAISKSAKNIFIAPVSATGGELTKPEKLPAPLVKPDDELPTKHSPEFYKDLAEAEAASNAVEEPVQLTDTTNSKIYQVVEVLPNFPGGMNNFINYLSANLRYPAADKDNNIQGKAVMQFVVEQDGSLSHIQVIRSPSIAMGQEAARVLASSPKWTPGIQNGKPVRAQYTIPISFTLGDNPGNSLNNGTNLQGLNVRGIDNPSLIIVDGTEASNMQSVDVSKIASVTILQPTDAIKKYGQKGVNGVVLITTKKPITPQKTN